MNVSKQEQVGKDATRRGWRSGVALVCLGLALRAMLPLSAQPPLERGVGAAGTAEPTPVSESGSKAGAISANAVGPITGQGTTGNIAKFTGTNAIGNSVLDEVGGKITLGTPTPSGLLTVRGADDTFVINSTSPGSGIAVYGASTHGIGIRGRHLATSGANPGVIGETESAGLNATGVQGLVKPTASGVGSAGVRGINNGTGSNGCGVFGSHAGSAPGVRGESVSGTGVSGQSTGGTGVGGVSTNGYGMRGLSTNLNGVQGESTNASGVGGVGGVNGVSGVSTGGTGVRGSSTDGRGMHGLSTNGNGVHGDSTVASGVSGIGGSNGVSGVSTDGYGVRGRSTNGPGVYGASKGINLNPGQSGVFGTTSGQGNNGVWGYGVSGATGVAGSSDTGFAGYFEGDVHITGTLSKGGGSFKIDHPLDPANKYLSHSFVESPDMMNIYNGNVTTDAKGFANVTLPDYFKALNSEYRYQLTVIGTFAQAIVARKIDGHGRFVIRTDKPKVEVSWQVTGIRKDAYAKAHRIRVSQNKTGNERGAYLHPELFGQPKKKSIAWARRQPATQRFSVTP